jgi:hypothetical protein
VEEDGVKAKEDERYWRGVAVKLVVGEVAGDEEGTMLKLRAPRSHGTTRYQVTYTQDELLIVAVLPSVVLIPACRNCHHASCLSFDRRLMLQRFKNSLGMSRSREHPGGRSCFERLVLGVCRTSRQLSCACKSFNDLGSISAHYEASTIGRTMGTHKTLRDYKEVPALGNLAQESRLSSCLAGTMLQEMICHLRALYGSSGLNVQH